MKRLIVLVTLLLIVGCGKKTEKEVFIQNELYEEIPNTTEKDQDDIDDSGENLNGQELEENLEVQVDLNYKPIVINEMKGIYDDEIQWTLSHSYNQLEEIALTFLNHQIDWFCSKQKELENAVDTYKKYEANKKLVEQFYSVIISETKKTCIGLRMQACFYVEKIICSADTYDHMYDDLDYLYDFFYEEISDQIYNEIYDDLLDSMYDAFYDGVLGDAYNEIAYRDWSKMRSDAYESWSDARSDIYKEWSNYRSDIYELWSDLRSKAWRKDSDGLVDQYARYREKCKKKMQRENLTEIDLFPVS